MQTRCLRGRWRGTRGLLGGDARGAQAQSGSGVPGALLSGGGPRHRRTQGARPAARRAGARLVGQLGWGADSPGPLPRFPRASRSGWGSRKLIAAAAFPLDSATAAAPSEEALPESPSVPHDSCRSWAPPAPWSPRSGSVMDARLAGAAVWLPRPVPPRPDAPAALEWSCWPPSLSPDPSERPAAQCLLRARGEADSVSRAQREEARGGDCIQHSRAAESITGSCPPSTSS